MAGVHTDDTVPGRFHAADRGMGGDGDPGTGRGPRIPLDHQPGAGVPIGRGVRGRHEAVGGEVGTQPLGVIGADHAARHVQAVLEPDTGREVIRLLFAVEQEEVADRVEPDVGTGPVWELLEGTQTAAAQLDVERIGELGAYAADRLARTAAAEVAALDDDDVRHPGLGEVKRDARTHHTATDDHNIGRGRNGTEGGGGQQTTPFQRPPRRTKRGPFPGAAGLSGQSDADQLSPRHRAANQPLTSIKASRS